MKTNGAMVLLGCVLLCSGCATHYVRYDANSEPKAHWVYPKGQAKSWGAYEQRVTQADRDKGKVVLPTLILEARGHKPYEFTPSPIVLDKGFWNHKWQQGDRIIHGYQNSQQVRLEKDYAYQGPETPNTVKVVVNSEPQGAKIYESGKFVGNTPLELNYTVRNDNYRNGAINCTPLIAVMDGYLPVEFSAKLPLEDSWKYESGQTFQSSKGMLFLLRRDPNDQRPIIVQQGVPQQQGQQTVVIKQDPHYGREWETGMRALGEVVRPHSKADPYTTEQSIRALQGYGTLIDLMGR